MSDAGSELISMSALAENGKAISGPASERKQFSAEDKRKMKAEPGNPAAHRIVMIRRTVQLTLFAFFLVLFFTSTTNSTFFGVPKDLFMMLDFLPTIYHWLLSHHLAVYAIGPGLFILLLTLWGGRIFCGWICPLGTLIDISDRLLYRKGRLFYNRKRSETHRFRNFKFMYLLAGLGAAAFAVDILSFGDPLSLITRSFTFCFFGPIASVWNGILDAFDHAGLTDYLYSHIGWNMAAWHLPTAVYQNNFIPMLMIIGIIALSGFQERFWCRNLCPYGALLGLLSRWSLLRHHVHMDECIHCKKCEIQSRHGCYDNLDRKATNEVTHAITECIQCFRCETICPPDVIQIRSAVPAWVQQQVFHKNPEQDHLPKPQPPIDLGRRRILGAIGAGFLVSAAAKSDATNYQGIMRRYPKNNRAMRPPGALPERQFLEACTRCSECMKVCPTNALQPALLETGPEGIWTPLLIPSIGPCAEKCTACGDICPTHAIQPFTWQDKRYKLKMGLANVDHNTCVAWNGGRDCIVCAEVCPYSAVIFRDVFDDSLPKDPTQPITAPGNKGRTKRVPTVDEKLCTGCGICEYGCPVLPNHSIVVYTFQEDREFKAPPEKWTDGFFRGNWDARKDQGKDREYTHAVQQIQEMKQETGET
jgi:polyferredoxin